MIKHGELKDLLKGKFSFKDAKKCVIVHARKGIPGEVLEVKCDDGILETVQHVTENQMVIKNIEGSGEIYAVNTVDFDKRYVFIVRADEEWESYKAVGEIEYLKLDWQVVSGIKELFNEEGFLEFEPAWGGVMRARRGDFIAISKTNDSLYRIASNEFYKTYSTTKED